MTTDTMAMSQKITYLNAASMINRNPRRFVSLADLQEALTSRWADSVFSFMQWGEAKRWFSAAKSPEGTFGYTLMPQWKQTDKGDLLRDIEEYFEEC